MPSNGPHLRPVARVRVVVAMALALLLPAGVALADPAGPTNYRTTITSIAPQVPGMELEVFGGDSFLVLTLEPGMQALVYGYEHDLDRGIVDPYLRFSEDGTVEVNLRSPAKWLNEDRYAAVEEPDFVDPTAPPEWEVVATDGSYAWHDHRIHWMSPELPQAIDPSGGVQRVFPDERPVPMQVDGTEVVANIILEWEPSASPLPWALVALVVAAAGFVVGRRPDVLPWVVVGAGAVALVVSVGAVIGLPSGVGRPVPPLLLPPVAIGAALLARTREDDSRMMVLGLAALPLLGWSVVQFGALTAPIVPASIPVVAIRAAVGIAAGAGLATLVAVATTFLGGDLASLADLADDPA